MLAANVVINEIHYNPQDNQSLSEFIELFNAGDESADVSGLALFPTLSHTSFLLVQRSPQVTIVVTENAEAYSAEFDIGSGPFVAYEIEEGTSGRQNFGSARGDGLCCSFAHFVTSLAAFDSRSDGMRSDIAKCGYGRETMAIHQILPVTIKATKSWPNQPSRKNRQGI
ncbi:MAG: lamin tail domain-containing protein [Pirellulaceae bacterium]